MTTADNYNVRALPAHETKHIPLLVYPFRDISFALTQSNDGANNGTALWLGSQILSAFLTDALAPTCPQSTEHTLALTTKQILKPTRRTRSPCAIELGSGIGLTALVLAAQGWSVLATDTQAVVDAVLRPNILRNNPHSTRLLGSVHVRALDWSVPPEHWAWNDPHSITGPFSNDNDLNLNTNAPHSRGDEENEHENKLLGPPFNLILTSDTIYSAELVKPLLRTLKHLILLSAPIAESNSVANSKKKKSHPALYLALEARDPVQIASFFSQARDVWGFGAQRIPAGRVRRAMSRSGLGDWKTEDWEDVMIWRMFLLDSG